MSRYKRGLAPQPKGGLTQVQEDYLDALQLMCKNCHPDKVTEYVNSWNVEGLTWGEKLEEVNKLLGLRSTLRHPE